MSHIYHDVLLIYSDKQKKHCCNMIVDVLNGKARSYRRKERRLMKYAACVSHFLC